LLDAANQLRSRAYAGWRLFTPVFTPAQFLSCATDKENEKTAAPQAQMHFAAELCPLYPRKQTCAVQLGMSALGQ
jgi:hypothetical protein